MVSGKDESNDEDFFGRVRKRPLLIKWGIFIVLFRTLHLMDCQAGFVI